MFNVRIAGAESFSFSVITPPEYEIVSNGIRQVPGLGQVWFEYSHLWTFALAIRAVLNFIDNLDLVRSLLSNHRALFLPLLMLDLTCSDNCNMSHRVPDATNMF